MASLGFALALWLYWWRPRLPARIAGRFPGIHLTLVAKLYVDELYDATIVRPLVWLSDRVLARRIDAGLIDGVAVNGSARVIRGLAAHGLKYIQSGLAQGYLLLMIIGTFAIVLYMLR